MFSPPPLEAMEPPKTSVEPIQQAALPSRNEFIQNGFSNFAASATSGTASKQSVEIQQQHPAAVDCHLLQLRPASPQRKLRDSRERPGGGDQGDANGDGCCHQETRLRGIQV